MTKLFLVPTPVGNLEDMTFRGVRILKEADFILAEDTRTSGKLLSHYGIQTPMKPHHKYNEHRTVAAVIDRLKAGEIGAVITDAGTPAISDPGFLVVRECIENDIEVECLPGATAFVPALVNSGLPNNKFIFEGFLPNKKGRQTRLMALKNEIRTIVLYESPYKLLKTLRDLIAVFGPERKISVSREISKLHEETLRGTIEKLEQHFQNHTPKGEFVLVIAGKGESG